MVTPCTVLLVLDVGLKCALVEDCLILYQFKIDSIDTNNHECFLGPSGLSHSSRYGYDPYLDIPFFFNVFVRNCKFLE